MLLVETKPNCILKQETTDQKSCNYINLDWWLGCLRGSSHQVGGNLSAGENLCDRRGDPSFSLPHQESKPRCTGERFSVLYCAIQQPAVGIGSACQYRKRANKLFLPQSPFRFQAMYRGHSMPTLYTYINYFPRLTECCLSCTLQLPSRRQNLYFLR